jgi:hypothetical protein
LLAGAQRCQFRPQRGVFRVLRVLCVEIGHNVGSAVEFAQNSRQIEGLGRKIVISGDAIGVDAAGMRVPNISQHASRKRHLEAHQGDVARGGAGDKHRLVHAIVIDIQALTAGVIQDPQRVDGLGIGFSVGDPDEIRIGRIVVDHRRCDAFFGEQVEIRQAANEIWEFEFHIGVIGDRLRWNGDFGELHPFQRVSFVLVVGRRADRDSIATTSLGF